MFGRSPQAAYCPVPNGKGIKSATLTVKVTPNEKELIKEKAAEQGLTVSMYIYNILFSKGE